MHTADAGLASVAGVTRTAGLVREPEVEDAPGAAGPVGGGGGAGVVVVPVREVPEAGGGVPGAGVPGAEAGTGEEWTTASGGRAGRRSIAASQTSSCGSLADSPISLRRASASG